MVLLAHAGDLAGGRSDLPIPEQLFGAAAAVVLIVSFIGLAVLWPTPRLEQGGFRAFPSAVSRVLLSRRWRSRAALPACSCSGSSSGAG